ncbi:hypothetical protein HK098_001113 [Nowakowskiella sp. JEL0407]|nr:hypothetical protein HK098_001113 [Nowakowskiella sp. JEL0407]
MAANWLVLSLPFFLSRESILAIAPFHRDNNELLATTLSSSLLGSVLAYNWRGLPAVPAGLLVYSSLGFISQKSLISLRHWRQSIALQLLEQQQSEAQQSTQKPSVLDSTYWSKNHQYQEARSLTDREEAELDPLKSLFDWSVSGIKWLLRLHPDNVPDWASPLANALDLEYRKLLNVRLRVLEADVQELENRIETLRDNKLKDH